MESKNDIKNSNGNVTLSIDTLSISDISRNNNNNNNNNSSNLSSSTGSNSSIGSNGTSVSSLSNSSGSNHNNNNNNNNHQQHHILSTSTPSIHNLVGHNNHNHHGNHPLHNSTGSNNIHSNNHHNNHHGNHNNHHNGNMNGFGSSSSNNNSSSSNDLARTKQEDNYSMAKVYLNNKLTFNNHGLGRVDFNMKSEDLDQPWFHKEATRDVAITLLNNKPIGSFLIRPSSQAGSYAMSWMKSGNEIGHNLIYGLCPGYSLKQNSTTDRFWSLQKLVEDCDYLILPIQVSVTTKNIAKHSNARTNAEVVGRVVERVSSNDPTFTELSWSLCILGENTNESSDHCQKRTRVKFGDEEYTAPEILPLNGNSLALICQGLHNNTHTRSLYINGFEGYLRMSFIPNLVDADAIAIANLIRENKSLTLLNLSVNQISDNGTKLIAEALKENKTLKYISLSFNFIGKEGLVAISEAIRFNKSLDFIDVSNQLYKKRNSINLIHLDTERTLMALIEDTMKRKCELFGMSYKFLDMPQTLSPNNNSIGINCGASQSKLPYFHGYLTKAGAEKRLNAIAKGKNGSFLFYLNYYVPNCIFLAILVQKFTGTYEIEHKMIHRVHFGYRFVSGQGLSSVDQDLRDELLEEEQLYNFQLNNQTYNNTITHSNSYIYSYRHRPRRTGCGVVVPTLFEFCAWILASHPQYQDILNAFETMGGISERFKDIRDLVPLWGARDVVPIVSLDSFKHNISRKGVYPTLLSLYKLNRSKLTNPITTEQYQNYRNNLKLQQQQPTQSTGGDINNGITKNFISE